MINNDKYTEHVTQIIEYLKTEKTRKTALEILLCLSESEELIQVFLLLEIPKILIRLIENEDLDERPIALQILINLTSDERYLNSFIDLNAFHRITKLIMNTISQHSFLDQTSKSLTNSNNILSTDNSLQNQTNPNQAAYDLKLVIDKYIINSNTVNTQIKSKDAETFINLYFILLANLTSFELGKRALLDITDEQKKGILFFKLLDVFFEYIYNPCFDFCSSVIANISSLKEGRELILNTKVFKIFLIQFDKMNNMKMVNILRMIRNCCFEYEKYEEEILVKEGIMLGFLIKIILLANIEKNQMQKTGIEGIDIIYFPNFSSDVLTKEDIEIIDDLIIDIFLVLTNNSKAVECMKNKSVNQALVLVQKKLSYDETFKERIMVIQNILEGKK